jgi:hypothetical protein
VCSGERGLKNDGAVLIVKQAVYVFSCHTIKESKILSVESSIKS